MANGIKTPGTWIPGTKAGVVVESKYVKGGYITVDSTEERDRLLRETEVITPGTKIYVKNESVEYVYVEPTAGKGEFQNTLTNTVQEVAKEGYVKESQVTKIVEDTTGVLVEKAVKESVPDMVSEQVDAKFDSVSADIAKEATVAAKEAAVKEVTEQIQEDFVPTEKFNSELEPVKSDVAETKTEVEANKTAIEENASKIEELKSTAATKESLNNYYTKSDIDTKISGVYHYRGSVATYDDLPKQDVAVGDVYNVIDTGMNYAWTSEGWDALGNLFETDNYYTKEEADNEVASKLTDYAKTAEITEELDKKANSSEVNDKITSIENQITSLNGTITYGEF